MEIEDRKGEANTVYQITGIEGDMGQTTRLNFILQADGDVVLSLGDTETGRKLSIEFCTISSGGKNPTVLRGLQNIISNLVKENYHVWKQTGYWDGVAEGKRVVGPKAKCTICGEETTFLWEEWNEISLNQIISLDPQGELLRRQKA